MNQIDVGIIAWPRHSERLEYLERCIRRLRTYLECQDEVRFLCSAEAAECTREQRKLADRICRAYRVDLFCHHPPPSVGGNINNLFEHMQTRHLFLAEEDRLLTRKLDLRPGLELLRKYKDFALINYSTNKAKELCLRGESGINEFRFVSKDSPWAAVNMQILFQCEFDLKWGKYSVHKHDPDFAEREMNVRLKCEGAVTLYVPEQYFIHCGDVSAIDRGTPNVPHASTIRVDSRAGGSGEADS
jgi:hypothetical protein